MAILYDRAGTGWSDDTALPRTATEVTDELGAVLLAIAGPGPYVLVGHSLGGAYVQRFAQRFPGKVAGLVAEITAASRQQSQGIDQVNVAVGEMDKVIQQIAANAVESSPCDLHQARAFVGRRIRGHDQRCR